MNKNRLIRDEDDAIGEESQVAALETIYGPTKRATEDFFPGWPVGAEGAWVPWFVGAPNGRAVQASFGVTDGETLWAVRYATSGAARTLFVSADVDTIRRLYPENPRSRRLSPDDRLKRIRSRWILSPLRFQLLKREKEIEAALENSEANIARL